MIVRAALLLAALLPSTLRAEEGRSERFLGLLSRVPADLLDGSGDRGYDRLVFADRDAADQALARFPGLPQNVADHGAYGRLLSPLFIDSLAAGLEGGWRPLVGFDPDDIDASLAIEAPPDWAMLLRLDPAAAAEVPAALARSGYSSESRDGVAALARGEDHGIDMAAIDRADLFGRGLGAASRVAVDEGGLLTQANAWALFLRLRGEEPQGHPDLPALASVIDDPAWDGMEFVQAVVWPDQDALGQTGGAGLPRWRLGLLADMADGPGTSTMVAFTYADRPSAEEAARILRDGWSTHEDHAGITLAEMTGVEPTRIEVLGDGPYVTLVVLDAPSGTLSGDWPVNWPFYRLLITHAQQGIDLFGPQ